MLEQLDIKSKVCHIPYLTDKKKKNNFILIICKTGYATDVLNQALLCNTVTSCRPQGMFMKNAAMGKTTAGRGIPIVHLLS
jgi:hypothetical protein